MKAKQIFEADDGTPFESEEECKVYESMLAVQKNIETFLESDGNAYKSKQTISIARNAIVAWEQSKLVDPQS